MLTVQFQKGYHVLMFLPLRTSRPVDYVYSVPFYLEFCFGFAIPTLSWGCLLHCHLTKQPVYYCFEQNNRQSTLRGYLIAILVFHKMIAGREVAGLALHGRGSGKGDRQGTRHAYEQYAS